MELDPKDYDVVKLLTRLKNSNGAYPPELLTPRRQNYLRRVTEIGLGFGVAEGLKSTVRSGSRAGASSSITASGLIEAALVMAIVAEAGVTAYIYRDRIAEIIRSDASQPPVVEVTSAPETGAVSELPIVIINETEEVSATPSAIVTATPSGTPFALTSAANNDEGGEDYQAVSTPDPNGNNGNQFGLTPKPDRTQEPGGGGNGNNNNDNGNGRGGDR